MATPWVESAAGIESMFTVVALIVGAGWALFGDWRRSKEEREHDRELAKQDHQRRKDTLEQQARRLRWDQANMAREVNHQFLDDWQAHVVLGLVDCELETYRAEDKEEGKQYTYNFAQKEDVHAMDTHDGAQLSEKDIFLRDCFDAWFYWMALMEQYLRSDLIVEGDIDYPSRYYIGRLYEDEALTAACFSYLRHYDIEKNVGPFLERFRPKIRPDSAH